MFAWLRSLKKSTPSRGYLFSKDPDIIRVELKEFAPNITAFLSLNALAQLSLYEAASHAVLAAPNLEAKVAIAEIAAGALEKHHSFAAELKKRGKKPQEVMAEYLPVAQDFAARITPPDWHQHVLGILLVGGMLENCLAQIAQGLKDSFKKTAIEILKDDTERQALQGLLAAEIAADPQLADRLALWGRRLVGDTMLMVRAILSLSENRKFVDAEMEPIFTEITGEHMLRMDSLGLTA